MHAGIRKQFQGTLGLSWKAQPVLSSPSNDKRVQECMSRRALLLFTVCKLVQQLIKSGSGDISAQLIERNVRRHVAGP